ncbi:MAG: orotate phosphoribosyltransferase [Bacillota bacterium]
MSDCADCISREEILQLFRETGVLLEGHFRLTSGMHSPQFLQCARVLRFPEQARRLTRIMAGPFRDAGVDKVVGPALGGIILSYEVARHLGAEALFVEKSDGRMALRRGFSAGPGDRVLVVEDAVSTGGSVNAVMEIFSQLRAEIVGVSVLVDRTGGATDFGVPFHSVLTMDIPAYSPASCPLCREGVPLTYPKDLGM